jgi:hypothetical protein
MLILSSEYTVQPSKNTLTGIKYNHNHTGTQYHAPNQKNSWIKQTLRSNTPGTPRSPFIL